MTEEADPIGAMVAALLAHGPTQALAGADIFGCELPAEAAARMPAPMIVIAPSGGVSLTGSSKIEADTMRFDLLAYAGTPRDADQLRATAARRLWSIEREILAGTLIHWVNRAGGFAQARDREGQWPQSFQSFQIFYSLKEVN